MRLNNSLKTDGLYARESLILASLAAATVIPGIVWQPRLALLVAAVILGWAQLNSG